MSKPTVDSVIAAYIKRRDLKKEIQTRHKEELAVVNGAMDKIEAWLHREMLEMNVDSVKTKAGTAFIQTVSSVKVADWETALDFLKKEELYHMLEHRLAKSSVEEFVENVGSNFPGTSLTKTQVVRFRR